MVNLEFESSTDPSETLTWPQIVYKYVDKLFQDQRDNPRRGSANLLYTFEDLEMLHMVQKDDNLLMLLHKTKDIDGYTLHMEVRGWNANDTNDTDAPPDGRKYYLIEHDTVHDHSTPVEPEVYDYRQVYAESNVTIEDVFDALLTAHPISHEEYIHREIANVSLKHMRQAIL